MTYATNSDVYEAVDKIKNNVLIMTVGPPKSGKTTWAKQLGFPIVCPDSIRLALHGKLFIPQAEQMVWAIVDTSVKAHFAYGHKTVVLDATSISRNRRQSWRSNRWTRIMCVFQTPIQTCLKRARGDDTLSREDLYAIEGVIEKHAKIRRFSVENDLREDELQFLVDGGT